MRFVLMVAAAAFSSSQAAAIELTPDQLYLLTKDLNDPESARVRNVSSPEELPTAVCGEVNWRGTQGGYLGYKKFWIANGHFAIEGDDLFKTGYGVLGCP